MVDISKINKRIAVFIILLIFVLLIGWYVKMTVLKPEPYPNEGNVAGLVVQFKDGIAGQDAKNIIENYNFTVYEIDCPVYNMPDKYYIKVDKDKIMDVRDELKKENWTESIPAFGKGNYYITAKEDYYIITISEQAIHDKNFLAILENYNLEVRKFVYCHIRFGEHTLSGISKEHANELKSKLETNENIFAVYFESIEE